MKLSIGDMIIAVDFDGVLNASPYPHTGVVVSHAISSMKELHYRGHHLIIWTCREGKDLVNAINFLLDKGIPFDGVNCNARANIELYSNDSRKINADLYIDDRQVGGWQGWIAVMDYVKRLEEDMK